MHFNEPDLWCYLRVTYCRLVWLFNQGVKVLNGLRITDLLTAHDDSYMVTQQIPTMSNAASLDVLLQKKLLV